MADRQVPSFTEIQALADFYHGVVAGNPQCKFCGGRRGWYGISVTTDQNDKPVYHPQICCGKVGKSETARMEERLSAQIRDSELRLGKFFNDISAILYSRTFFGGIHTFYNHITTFFKKIVNKIRQRQFKKAKKNGLTNEATSPAVLSNT